MASAKVFHAIRRNELLLLASLLAGLVMALFEMAATWATGNGLWAFPGLVSGTVFRSLQTAGSTVSFSVTQIAAGLGLHLLVAIALGLAFAKLAPGLRTVLGLERIEETPAYGLLGAAFGTGVFGVAWWGVLPAVNPIMVQGLDPTFLGLAHAVWGSLLGITRKAWIQRAPSVTRSASAAPQPTPAGSAHKAPPGSSTTRSSPSEGTAAGEAADHDVATFEPEPSPTDDEDDAPEGEDPIGSEPASAYGGEHERWSTKHEASADEDEASADEDEASSSGDELSPWPEPASEPSSDEEASQENGYASSQPSSSSRDASSSSAEEEEDDEDDGLNMTEHARRSLEGLTRREPDLPPVHKALNTTLTHVAPGRAVCTLEADERLHDATGAVQPGVLTSLAELAATIAAQTAMPEAQHATVSSSIQVEASIEEGHVVAEAEVTEQAGTTTLTEVEVRDATGKVLVRASFQAATGEPADG